LPRIIARQPGWENRLKCLFLAQASRPFSWHDHNCALFAAAGVIALRGEDPAAAYRGMERAPWQRRRDVIRSGRLEQAVTEALGPPLASVRGAGRGDIALVPPGRHAGPDGTVIVRREIVGVIGFDGQNIMVLMRRGLTRVPLGAARLAWHV
jgi:hypothetical protein